jgi:hypothetical protein
LSLELVDDPVVDRGAAAQWTPPPTISAAELIVNPMFQADIMDFYYPND